MADNGENVPMADAGDSSGHKIHHTVTACVRCRQRKTRCDPALPRCEPCERTNAHCEYFDSVKNRTIPRTYITSLQETVRRLNEELKTLNMEDDYEPDHEVMAREAGLVSFSDNEESRFLGPSSGIAITRFVMEFAKRNSVRRTIKDVVPQHAAQEIKQKFDAESSKPTSKVYPLISSVAAPDLPNRDLMERLVDIYMVKAQYMLPLLHEPTFKNDLQAVYAGSKDPTLNFQVRLVTAISMQKLDTQYAGLADSYYLAALPYLVGAMRKKDLSTLQCYALIAQYSLLTPTRTAAYWVVGLAARLCQEIGICEEETIDKLPSGAQLNPLEIDMRRRLYWIITSMEYGLAHSLGRPSAFGTTVDNINVNFFELCDDRYITPDGLQPGHHAIMKKCIAIHFLRMRLLQAEIRRCLYLRKRETPVIDTDPWFHQMLQRIDEWVRDCPKNDEGSGLSEAWFHGRRNTMIIFMYRPSPQIPTPSFDAAMRCYEAAVFNIHLQKRQVEARLIDITWIFTQAINMALNTVLWSMSYPGIRQLHPVEEVRGHVQAALIALDLCADRWPGVRSAVQLYENLITRCIKAYESDRLGDSPVSENTPSYTNLDVSSAGSQAAQSPASTAATSYYGPQSPQPMHNGQLQAPNSTHAFKKSASGFHDQVKAHTNINSQINGHSPQPQMSQPYTTSTAQLNVPATSLHYSLPDFDIMSSSYIPTTSQGLSQWNPMATAANTDTGFPRSIDFEYSQPWLASFGDEYSRYLHQSYGPQSNQIQTLSEQQQMELMTSLEQSQLPDISGLVSDATTFYTPHLP